MTRDPDKRLALRIPVVCMWASHGTLTAYQDAEGRISVKPCEYCLNQKAVEQIEATDKAWREKVSRAIGAQP